MAQEIILVDPRKLRLPSSRREGADPAKLQRQIHRFGKSTLGMPPLFVHQDKAGELMIVDGVTRATRVAKLLPGEKVSVEITCNQTKADFSKLPTVEEKLP